MEQARTQLLGITHHYEFLYATQICCSCYFECLHCVLCTIKNTTNVQLIFVSLQ
jgi:hypothetical protein